MPLSEQQRERYSRQVILSEIGMAGMEKLLGSRVLIVGAGGLGSPAALYLAGSGIGTLGISDGDKVDLSNLHRQILHTSKDVGTSKTKSAFDKMKSINPDLKINVHYALDEKNILEIIEKYDFVIDGTDNFPSKFLVNDACVILGKSFSHAGILRFDGQTMTVNPHHSACYRCVFEEPPELGSIPNCAQAGIIGPVAGILGSIQAAEAIKYCLGMDGLLYDQLLTIDATHFDFRKIKISRSPHCRVCGPNKDIFKPFLEASQKC